MGPPYFDAYSIWSLEGKHKGHQANFLVPLPLFEGVLAVLGWKWRSRFWDVSPGFFGPGF